MGRIVTFFSYKGGVGRSMALANVGVLLARWGHRVLMVDWDLEAPGLENFFHGHLDQSTAAEAPGVIDLLYRGYKATGELAEISYWHDYPMTVRIPDVGGTLQLLTAGRQDGDYFHKVQSLDVKTLYSKQHGGQLIELLRNDWKKTYDFVLIDSRTGITDIGGICTVQLPDLLLVLFTATDQALRGTLAVAEKAARARQKLPFERLQVPALPIPSRFDSLPEFKVSQEWLDRFAAELKPLYEGWLPRSVARRDVLEVTKLPYVSYFSFGEKLPVVEQGTNDPASLGHAYANIAALVAHGLENIELFLEDRSEYVRSARARVRLSRSKVLILYHHADQVWLDRLADHLVALRLEIEAYDIAELSNAPEAKHEFRRSLSASALALLLTSAEMVRYLSSNSLGLNRVFEQETSHGLVLVPLVLKPCAWEGIPWLAKRQALPRDAKPLSTLPTTELETSLAKVAAEVSTVVQASSAATATPRQRGPVSFDVFLSHHSDNSEDAEQLAKALVTRGLKVWLSTDELRPGAAWEEEIEGAISESRAVAVLVGESGLGEWQEKEIRHALSPGSRSLGKPVIPVLLPGAPDHLELPLLLHNLAQVDLRGGITPAGLDRLEWGITGIRPNEGDPYSKWPSIIT